jgi:hypothetical protein
MHGVRARVFRGAGARDTVRQSQLLLEPDRIRSLVSVQSPMALNIRDLYVGQWLPELIMSSSLLFLV